MTPIWFNKSLQISELLNFGINNLSGHLGMEFTQLGPDYISARMPVDDRTRQPYGLLHGGASVALAETLGSAASHMVVDASEFMVVGIEINANHIRSVREGYVTGTCHPLHLGSSIHVWEIKIRNELEKLICISRLTVAVIRKGDR